MISRPPSSNKPLVIHLSSISAYSTFGELLRTIRNHHNTTFHETLSPQKITAALNPLLKEEKRAKNKVLGKRAYADLENGRRYPRFVELELIFRVLVETFYIDFTDLEIMAYVHLAEEKIRQNQKPKQEEKISEADWETLEATLFRIHQSKPGRVHLVIDGPTQSESSAPTEDPFSRRRRAITKAIDTDVRDLLEREEWVKKMLLYPEKNPPVKLIVIQGAIGVGKSCAQALLIQRLAEQSPNYYPIPYLFQPGEGKTPEDHLDEFLAVILADLTLANVSGEMKQQPLADRINQILTAIKSRKEKVIFLLDDLQYIFPTGGEWSPSWLEFMETFVRESHSSTLYAMTRTWPGWDERRLAYIEPSELPDLSLAASVKLWQDRGFDDVPEDILQDVCSRCGCNPQMMEMLIAQCKKRFFSSSRWNQGTLSSQNENKKSANTTRLEAVLAQETIFDLKTDVKSREVLQYALTSRLNHQARQMLECLALSPLGLPFALLGEEFANAEIALNELASVSALDLNMAASQRAAVIPFVREAVIQSLMNEGRGDGIESRVTDLYTHWLNDIQDFRDDSEKAGLIAEMIVRCIRHRQLLKAADLFIQFGWLCTLFGHVSRIQRVYDEITRTERGKLLDPTQQTGQLLLQYHLPFLLGGKINPRTRDTDFQHIRDLALEGQITLKPHLDIYIANTLMSRMFYEKRYQDAYNFWQDTMHRVTKFGVHPEVLASFQHNKANLLGRWSSQATEMRLFEDAIRLLSECVGVLAQTVETWRTCLKNPLPVQEQYYHFKLARALNDLAYYSRKLGHLSDAEKAIIECLFLKEKKKATLPISLAVSLGEYAQILKEQGRYREAEVKNAQAIQHIDQLLQSSDLSAHEDKGMLLVERASIYEMQGRLDEAKVLLKDALALIHEDRDSFRFEAEQQLAHIQVIEESTPRYQLDSRWYPEYLPLAKYDDLRWLSQAGPFNNEEQRMWDQLYSQQDDEKIWEQLSKIIQQSKEREFEQSAVEGRLPRILYPAIDIDDLRSRMRGFSKLKETIERDETNIVMRRLYTKKIEEHLLILRLVEGTYKHNTDELRICNEALYGKITKAEMTIALREFFKMLKRAQNHPQAATLADQILKQLRQWHLFAEDFMIAEDEATKKAVSKKLQQWRKTPVSSRAVQQLYEAALKSYGFREWRVILSPERDTISLDLDLCILRLPTNNHFTVLSAAEFLTEEIETHILRSMSGKRSKLALLSSGTRGFLPTEEGLATVAIQEMMDAQELGQKSNTWTTTLSTGMATGVLIPPQSFGSLYDLFAKAFLANHIQSERYRTICEAEEAARYDALVRISRTFRGIPNLETIGIGNLKDRVYLQGYQAVSEVLTKVSREQLYVGSIGIDDLADMEDLHILQPSVANLYLSHDPQLFDKIIAYEKQ